MVPCKTQKTSNSWTSNLNTSGAQPFSSQEFQLHSHTQKQFQEKQGRQKYCGIQREGRSDFHHRKEVHTLKQIVIPEFSHLRTFNTPVIITITQEKAIVSDKLTLEILKIWEEVTNKRIRDLAKNGPGPRARDNFSKHISRVKAWIKLGQLIADTKMIDGEIDQAEKLDDKLLLMIGRIYKKEFLLKVQVPIEMARKHPSSFDGFGKTSPKRRKTIMYMNEYMIR
jgi:hypothetical protein